jgi:methyltransferase (TIGR00027 family)
MPLAQSSRTALLVAAYRARASARRGAVCDDPFAARLAGGEGEALARRFDPFQPDVELWVAIRTAHLDARVRALVAERGAPPARRQVVILGAGLDTRAARLARPGVRFFEVDAPPSAADKQERLAALGDYPAHAATYVSCDFEREDFMARLAEAGFDVEAPSVFVFEGVIYYLQESAARAALERLARVPHPQSVVLFDYVGSRMARGTVRHPGDREMSRELGALGEPLRFGIDDVLPLLYDAGFRRARVASFDELALNLTGTYSRARRWRAQGIAEASVAAPVGLCP